MVFFLTGIEEISTLLLVLLTDMHIYTSTAGIYNGKTVPDMAELEQVCANRSTRNQLPNVPRCVVSSSIVSSISNVRPIDLYTKQVAV